MTRVAIVGFQGRFPGGATCSEVFFDQLLAAENFCGDVPADRWSQAAFVTDDMAAGKTPTGRGAFIDYDYRGFDADLFALSADEIAYLDPQQRLVLEVAWEALEHAAMDPVALAGQSVGVYVGGFTTDHLLNQFSAQARSALGRFSAAGSTLTMLANRLSYALDLRGPSLTIDTACASGLTATAAAVGDLEAGRCRMALAGGVNFMLRPEYQIGMSAAGLLAIDGRSKPFSNLADGYGRGEGCAVLVLKRLVDAQADGDRIWGVIEAIGTGHDGRTAGISLPNGQAQAELMRQVLAESGLAPGDIGYVEAHGTGTVRGDGIEARSIGSVYGRGVRRDPLPIGSVKANIGHLEAAAGIAGVIKALLMLQSGRIPPHPLVGFPNANIPFQALNLHLPRDAQELKSPWVAVNAFGYGGSNAHAILGLPTGGTRPLARPASPPDESKAMMLPLSAQSAEALAGWLPRLAERVARGIPLADLQHTLARRRGHRAFRTAIWVERSDDPVAVAAQIRDALTPPDAIQGRNANDGPARTLFVFSGMGPQWSGMGRSLWATEPVFRAAVEETDLAFRAVADLSLIDMITGPESSEALRGCRIAQPLNFALQVGLVRLLSAYGLDPNLCLGHSAGEVAAAWCAGHLSLDQAAAVCWARSELQDSLAGRGGMVAAAITADAAAALCAEIPGLEVAAFNARRSIAFAGSEAALARAEAALDRSKIPFRRLSVDIAYHSADMDSILPLLETRLRGLVPTPPALPLLSSVTAAPVSEIDRMDAGYWRANVRAPVRFREALEAALARGATHCIEIGAGPVLRGAITQVASDNAHDITVIPTLAGDAAEQLAIRRALTRVYVSGGPLDWSRLAPTGKIATLPPTGWQRRNFWHETDVQAQDRLRLPAGNRWAEPSLVPHSWVADLNAQAFAFLGEHRIEGVSILPGTAALEAALQTSLAVRDVDDARLPARLTDIRFENPSPLNRKTGQLLDSRHVDGALEVLVYNPASPQGVVRVLGARIAAPEPRPEPRALLEFARFAPHPLDPDAHRTRLAALGIAHGPAFQVVQRVALSADGTAVFAQLATGGSRGVEHDLRNAPCLLDGVFQAALALTTGCEPLVPVSIRSYTLHSSLPRHLWAWITLGVAADDGLRFDAALYDSAGECLAQLDDIRVRPLRPQQGAAPLPEMALIQSWSEADIGADRARRPRVAVSGADAERLRTELAAAGVEEAAGEADATVVLCPREPALLAATLEDAIARSTDPASGRVYLVTRNALAISPCESAQPDQAALWGLGRTLFNELPAANATMVDVAAGDAWHAAVAREIAAASPSSEVAFRGGRRLLPQLDAIALPDSEVPRFHGDRTYLITGGLGGFGQQLALWLARNGAGRIVLTSRSTPAQARVAPLARALSTLGAELVVVPLDMADTAAVRALVHSMPAAAPLGGIFHWAGATADRPAAEMTAEALRLVLKPKVRGADALHAASVDLPIDHFVLASSLSAIVGNPRQANYAAANAYLDGLAWARHAAGLPALSVNFGAIAGAGMAADPLVTAHLNAAGLPPMRMATALAGLGAAMQSGLAQVSLSRAIDGERWMRYDPRCAATDKMRGILAEARAAAAARRDIRAELSRLPHDGRARLLAERLRALLGEVLKCAPDRLSKDTALGRMGMDSLAAVEFQILVDRELGASLPITALIGGQTLNGIATTISRGLADAGE